MYVSTYTMVRTMLLAEDFGDDGNRGFIQDTISYAEICRFCAMAPRQKTGKEDMVLCDKCQSWYHCSCVGIAQVHFDDTFIPFFCCLPPTDYLNFV